MFIVALDYALRKATRDPKIGFMTQKRQSSRQPAVYIIDADFADDLANYIEQAQLFLLRLEVAGESIGLHVNHTKTEYMLYNQAEAELMTLDRKKLKQAKTSSTLVHGLHLAREIWKEVRIGMAWKALNKMDKIWKSNLHRSLTIQFLEQQWRVFCCMVQRAGHLQKR